VDTSAADTETLVDMGLAEETPDPSITPPPEPPPLPPEDPPADEPE
jgi:hypothetical protein